MDILYHGIMGYAIGNTLGGQYKEAGALAAILPDLIGTMPFFFYKMQEASKMSPDKIVLGFIKTASSNKFSNSVDRAWYYLMHSFTTTVLASFIAYIFWHPAWVVVTLAYLSHIIIDIPTHEGDFATRFLYPFSNVHKEYKNWVRNPKLFFAFWGALILIILFLSLT
jgi:membrane-bound metal-dependent hydrolase YbcI (DUF457 family)